MTDVHAGYGATPILFGVSLEVHAGEAIARVMMAGARLILMDEPTQGLAPAFIRHIRDMVSELKRLGVTVLLVEQNARVALSVCDRGYIMEKGAIVFEASSRELRESPVTREKLGV